MNLWPDELHLLGLLENVENGYALATDAPYAQLLPHGYATIHSGQALPGNRPVSHLKLTTTGSERLYVLRAKQNMPNPPPPPAKTYL
ncbi:hypothetical protein ABH900_003580 [Stenotrophomonas sp. AN71]|uniref:hypothetical protein n=1 Tax=Stenotrophomonas sp. AN71 TaxID=3156253 RepID=UPI003D1936B3